MRSRSQGDRGDDHRHHQPHSDEPRRTRVPPITSPVPPAAMTPHPVLTVRSDPNGGEASGRRRGRRPAWPRRRRAWRCSRTSGGPAISIGPWLAEQAEGLLGERPELRDRVLGQGASGSAPWPGRRRSVPWRFVASQPRVSTPGSDPPLYQTVGHSDGSSPIPACLRERIVDKRRRRRARRQHLQAGERLADVEGRREPLDRVDVARVREKPEPMAPSGQRVDRRGEERGPLVLRRGQVAIAPGPRT